MKERLSGKRIAIIVANEFEDIELLYLSSSGQSLYSSPKDYLNIYSKRFQRTR